MAYGGKIPRGKKYGAGNDWPQIEPVRRGEKLRTRKGRKSWRRIAELPEGGAGIPPWPHRMGGNAAESQRGKGNYRRNQGPFNFRGWDQPSIKIIYKKCPTAWGLTLDDRFEGGGGSTWPWGGSIRGVKTRRAGAETSPKEGLKSRARRKRREAMTVGDGRKCTRPRSYPSPSNA